MKKYFHVFLLFALAIAIGCKKTIVLNKPKLVIGIVVDQMRYDFMYKYWDKYSNNGIKRLISEGFSCEQAHYVYMPTYTGPGHASVYTGTTPSTHGIIANNWYQRKSGKMIYCTDDSSVNTVGDTSRAGKMSPRLLLSSTIGDQLKLSDNNKSKVIGIALKDRGAILPAGHNADAAYWFSDASHNWITSDYYMKDLPQWVKDFNAQKLPDQYVNQTWNTLLPIESYTESMADRNPYEQGLPGESSPIFPYDVAAIAKATGNIGVLRSTPFGNQLTADFALAALEGEKMGQGSETDFLCVSFSSTDYVGHANGPNSIETEDTYLRLDRDIARMLKYIDKKYGKDNVLVFLTADHGITEVPAYLQSLKIPASYVKEKDILAQTKRFCQDTYGDTLIKSYSNQQFFIDRNKVVEKKLELEDVQQAIADFALTIPEVAEAYTVSQMMNGSFTKTPAYQVQNGYNFNRSGDVMVNYQLNVIDFGKQGTTHGSPYSYDTHVPLLWYGWSIKHGTLDRPVEISDIAVTIAEKLHIMEPNGATGRVIVDVMK